MEPKPNDLITAEMLRMAMENGLGPLTGRFEGFALQRAHDLWIKGSELIEEAEALIRQYERCPW